MRGTHTWPADLEPCWIASSACGEVSGFLHVHIPKRYEVWLTKKAEVCFQKNERFRRSVRGNSGRDRLVMFTRHWLSSLLKCERLDLWYCLPDSYDMGHPLPRGEHPRMNRRNSLDLPPWRNWNAARVHASARWQFLARRHRSLECYAIE